MRTYLSVVMVAAGCGGSPGAGSTPTPEVPVDGAVGPRALPPTFVALEVDAFPRPAAEACAAPAHEMHLVAGESIHSAIGAAAPGTTVWVGPGTYVEQPGHWVAVEWTTADLCLRAEGGEVVIQAAEGQRYGLQIFADDAVVEGITLKGFESNVSLAGVEGVTQRRTTLERLGISEPVGDFIDGVVAYGRLDGLLLLDSEVRGADLSVSCNAGPCAHWWIEGSRIEARAAVEGSGADGIAVEDGRQIVVLDSAVSGAAADGIDLKADEVVVFGVRVTDVGRNGIKLWRGGDVIDSVVSGTGADASLVGDAVGRYRYLHVLVQGHGGPGAAGYVGTWGYDEPGPGMRVEFINSVFTDNSAGGLMVAGPDAQVTFEHTLVDAADHKVLELSDGSVFLGSQLEQLEAAGHGRGNMLADPQLVAFAPGAGSPLRDAGVVVEGLDRDLDGGPRSVGAGPDIGPVEARD